MKNHYITFRSVTFAQQGERVLRRGGVDSILLRTPRWMEERGCGYCLRIKPADTVKSLELLRSAGAGFSKVYMHKDDGTVEELRYDLS